MDMDDSQISDLFAPLYEDISGDEWVRRKPLLAHYTSIQTLEKIVQTSELWFSNPLFMNDLEEVRFGMLQGVPRVLNSAEIAAA